MREHGMDAVLAGSPGLVAFLTGHVVPAHLAYPSRDARLEKPTLALVTADAVITIGSDPRPGYGEAVPYGDGALGLSDGPAAFAAVERAVAELGLTAGRLAVELALVPAGALAAVQRAAPRLGIEPLDGALEAAKTAKSDEEAAGIAEAVALTDAGHDAIRAATAEGVSEVQLYAEAVRAMNERAGSLVIPLCELQVGPRAENFFENAAPTGARLRRGELVMADIAPRHPNGWWADSCSTVACGEVAPEVQAEWEGLRDGLEAGRELLRPGVAAGDVFDAVERYAGEQLAYVGHGIGRDHLEGPKLAPGNTEPIPEGAVIVIEPGRYGNGRGMRIEHAFRAGPDGGVPLSRFSLAL
jgi:Xaa-Pro aminopeptidase